MSAPTKTRQSDAIAELIERSRLEILPLDGTAEKVVAHVPRDVTLTVTASPTKGLDATFALAEQLIDEGYTVVPHLSARLVESKARLGERLAQAESLGMRDVFVIAGDAEQPAGPYEGSLPLLRDMAELGHPFLHVGIAGYPETHPLFDDATAIAAMTEKQEYATYIATQVCFDSHLTASWIEQVWGRGTRLPVYVGIPGAVSRAKLLRVSARIGIGQSLRFLRKNGSFASRFLSGGFDPDQLIDGLGGLLTDPDGKLAGFHVFTFNDIEDTEIWRLNLLREGGRA
ncbi:MAG: methylenetetrahydrofolate reductase [Gaiellales bacterium]